MAEYRPAHESIAWPRMQVQLLVNTLLPRLARKLFAFTVLASIVIMPARAAEVTVFAAVSLTEPMTAIAEAIRSEHAIDVRLALAASSTLARQIEAGAPADLYISANPDWVDYLEQRELIDGATRRAPLGNSIVIAAPSEPHIEPFEISASEPLSRHLRNDDRVAVAEPAHVPAGMYFAAAMRAIGDWDEISPYLVRTDNTRAALALIERGEVRFGAVYASDARVSHKVQVVSTLAQSWHAPIRYTLAVVTGHRSDPVMTVYRYLSSAAALAEFERIGLSSTP